MSSHDTAVSMALVLNFIIVFGCAGLALVQFAQAHTGTAIGWTCGFLLGLAVFVVGIPYWV